MQIITRTYIDNSLPHMIATGGLVRWQMLPQSIFGLLITRGLGTSVTTNSLSLLTVPIFVIPFARYLESFQGDFWSVLVILGLILSSF